MSQRLIESLVTTEALADVFSDAALLGSMCRFEIALARAEARAGVIPAPAAEAIARALDPAAIDPASPHGALDVDAIVRGGRASGTIVIPFVEAIRARVRAVDPAAATFVHWGATSQDVGDTALVLCLACALPILTADHERLAGALRRLSDRHADTIMLARTLLQPAPPITFGIKAAGWFGAVSRGAARVHTAFREACVLQFGGSSGTLPVLGSRGPAVAADLARELELPVPDAPWHAHRDRLAALVSSCGAYTATLGKIARDVALLMQHEVGEASEPGGGSSAMPHKRNPSGSVVALAAATRMPGLVAAFLAGMPQEHERGAGGWQAEMATVAAAVQTTGAALAAIANVIEGLRVDPDRMRANLESTHGLVLAERAMALLAPALGADAARRAIDAAIEATHRDGTHFVEALAAQPDVAPLQDAGVLSDLRDPSACLGSAEAFRRRLVERSSLEAHPADPQQQQAPQPPPPPQPPSPPPQQQPPQQQPPQQQSQPPQQPPLQPPPGRPPDPEST